MNDTNRALSDYEANLALIVVNGFVTERSAGLMASLISYYERTMEREALAAKEKLSKHVGTVGARDVFKGLTLVSTRSWEGQFGYTTLHKFISAEGNIFTWFASGLDTPFKQGETYDVKATVKKHDTYNGVAQTVLNRAAIDVPKAPTARKPRAKKAAPSLTEGSCDSRIVDRSDLYENGPDRGIGAAAE
jgi:hypothetical protein